MFMNRILEKQQLSEEVFRIRVEAPDIAKARKAGQFIILMLDSNFGERIPLTIADADPEKGSITLIFQTVGNTTHRLALLNEGDQIENILGPLGTPTHIENFGTAVCVGGGIGTAPLYPIVEALKKAGNRIITIIGARTKELIVMEGEMRALSDELIVCTDDGSYGRKALVTEPLKELCERTPKPDIAVAIGPPIITGMCGGCRVSVGGKTKFVCVDGPEFDGHAVDFDLMMKRLRAFKPREDADHEKCHLEIEIERKKHDA
jgi:ferredoxin--NADP+ reductase